MRLKQVLIYMMKNLYQESMPPFLHDKLFMLRALLAPISPFVLVLRRHTVIYRDNWAFSYSAQVSTDVSYLKVLLPLPSQ